MLHLPSRRLASVLGQRSALVYTLAVLALSSGSPAFAQSATCDDFGKTLNERKELVARLSAITANKKNLDLKGACSGFSSLVTNGTKALKWLDANKDWCQIPEPFVENIKSDHTRAATLRGQACGALAQQAAMAKKAQAAQQGGGGGSGLLGGDGLTGSFKIPQGAM